MKLYDLNARLKWSRKKLKQRTGKLLSKHQDERMNLTAVRRIRDASSIAQKTPKRIARV